MKLSKAKRYNSLIQIILLSSSKKYLNPRSSYIILISMGYLNEEEEFDEKKHIIEREENNSIRDLFLFNDIDFYYARNTIQNTIQLKPPPPSSTTTTFSPTCHLKTLHDKGWFVIDNYIQPIEVKSLRQMIENDNKSIIWQHPLNANVTRDDKIAWLQRKTINGNTTNNNGLHDTLINLFQPILVEMLRTVPSVDGHADNLKIEYQLASYKSKANGYTRHVDYNLNIREKMNLHGNTVYSLNKKSSSSMTGRFLSMVLYLNDEWKTKDGGDLRIWFPRSVQATKGTSCADISPIGGRLVVFLSSSIPHQVRSMQSNKKRIAITAWVHGCYELKQSDLKFHRT
jgi:hypothetical protein